jgi:hypothetical protein
MAELSGGYSKSFLRTARTIFEMYEIVCDHALMNDDYPGEKARNAIYWVRYGHGRGYFDDDIPDYLILGVLAIAEAWDCLDEILIDGLGRSPCVIEQVQDAQQLVTLAKEERESEVLQRVREELEARRAQAEEYGEELQRITLGKKQNGQRERAATKESRWRGWQLEEGLIYKDHPEWGREGAAIEISKRLRMLRSELTWTYVKKYVTKEQKRLLDQYPEKAKKIKKLLATFPNKAFQKPVSWTRIYRKLNGPDK